MERHEFLRHLHRLVDPSNYLEIGVQKGKSLSISRVPSIGVDPEFVINRALRCDLHLVRATSDEFFAHRDPIRHLRSGRNPLRNLRRGRPLFDYYRGGTRLHLVFVDGMHLFEFALRDFMNVERHAAGGASSCSTTSCRARSTSGAGSAYGRLDRRRLQAIRRYPVSARSARDPVDTSDGAAGHLGADPANGELGSIRAIVAEGVVPDPQPVPAWVLDRTAAISPDA